MAKQNLNEFSESSNLNNVILTLQPWVMLTPAAGCIYQKNRLREPREITASEFKAKFKPCMIKIAVNGDVNDWTTTLAYSSGLDCWFTVEMAVQAVFGAKEYSLTIKSE